MHTGVFETSSWMRPDISYAEVAKAGGVDIKTDEPQVTATCFVLRVA